MGARACGERMRARSGSAHAQPRYAVGPKYNLLDGRIAHGRASLGV